MPDPADPAKVPLADAPAAEMHDDSTITDAPPANPSMTLPDPPLSAPPSAPPRPVPDLRELVGMDRSGLGGLLGKPTLRRTEPPAEVWQYSTAQCTLHLFLYSDGGHEGYRVSHVDVVRRQQQTIQPIEPQGASFPQECFGHVLHRATAQNQAR